jgi:hypothetical protein
MEDVVPPLWAVEEPAVGGVAIGSIGASVLPWTGGCGAGIGSGMGSGAGAGSGGVGIGSPGAGGVSGGTGSVGCIGSAGGGGAMVSCAMTAMGLTATRAAKPRLLSNLLCICNLLRPVATR